MRVLLLLMFLPSLAFSAVYSFNNAQLTHIAEIIADDPSIKSDYAISADVLAQNKAFSFRIDTERKDFIKTYKNILADSGVSVTVNNGFYRYNVTKPVEVKKCCISTNRHTARRKNWPTPLRIKVQYLGHLIIFFLMRNLMTLPNLSK